jgi:putative membrane protein
MLSKRLFGAVAAGAIVLAACGGGDDAATTDTAATTGQPAENGTAGPSETADAAAPAGGEEMQRAQTFVNAAAQANQAEIETSRLALERAQNADVKAFAQMIIDDHTKTADQMTAAVSAAGLTPPPTTLDEFHMRRVNDLNEDDGDEDFDRDYIAAQVDMHKDAIDLFRDYAENGQTQAVRAFAEQQLPALEAHRAKAEQLREALNKG